MSYDRIHLNRQTNREYYFIWLKLEETQYDMEPYRRLTGIGVKSQLWMILAGIGELYPQWQDVQNHNPV